MPIPNPEETFEVPVRGYTLTDEDAVSLTAYENLIVDRYPAFAPLRPQVLIDHLRQLVGQSFFTRDEFLDALKPVLTARVAADLGDLGANHLAVLTTLYWNELSPTVETFAYRYVNRGGYVRGEDGRMYDGRRLEYKPWGVDYFTYSLTDGHETREARVTLVFGSEFDEVFHNANVFPVLSVPPGDGFPSHRAFFPDFLYPGLFAAQARVTEGPAQGALEWGQSGLLYTAKIDASGVDRFRYHLPSDEGDARFVDVNYLIEGRAIPARRDAYTTRAGDTLHVPDAAGVLRNDRENVLAPLRIDRVTNPTQGRIVSWTQAGGFVYEPNPGARGTDSFTYRVLDDYGNWAEATVTITIHDPSAGDFRYVWTAGGDQVGLVAAPGTTITNFTLADDPQPPTGVTLPYGRLAFTIAGVSPGGTTTVTLLLPEDGPEVNSYWKYGPVWPRGFVGWYPFTFNPPTGTGAQFSAGRISLTFRDGGRGDADRRADGVITDPGGPAFSEVELLTPVVPFVGDTAFVVATSRQSEITVYNPDGTVRGTMNAFGDGYTGGVRAATADFNGDGVADLVVGTGPGSVVRVRVIDGATGEELFATDPFGDFTGGVFVAAGDIDRDGLPELVVTPDVGGGPRVRVFRGGDFVPLADFFGITDDAFRGGVRAAVGDVDGDGFADLAVSAGFGGGPRVAIFDGRALSSGAAVKLVNDFFVFNADLRDGAYLALGDADGDGTADLVAGAGDGGAPRVLVLRGRQLLLDGGVTPITTLASFYAGDPAGRRGVRVAVKDLDGDVHADLVIGNETQVTGFRGRDVAGRVAEPAFVYEVLSEDVGGVFVG